MARNETGLTHKQQRFVDEYLKDKNATQAYIRAGYKAKNDNSAAVLAHTLLKNAKVRDEIDSQLQRLSEECGVDLQRTLLEVGRVALFDPRKLFNDDGSPKAIHELDDDTAAAIAGVEVVQLGGDDAPAIIKKYKLTDKNAALEKLMKHFGAYEKDNRQKADPLTEFAKFIAERTGGSSRLPISDD